MAYQDNFGIYGMGATDIDMIAGVADIYAEEDHSGTVSKTNYPIESGSTRTDNAVVNPMVLVLRGLVSDLTDKPGQQGQQTPPISRGKDAWARLVALKDSRDLVNVVTTLGLYTNMLVTSLDAMVNERTGRGLYFTIVLEETIIVDTQIVKISASKVKKTSVAKTKASKVSHGTTQSEEPSEKKQSLLKEIIGAFG